MKLNRNKPLSKWLFTCTLLLLSYPALALKDDTRQPIDVLSDQQTLDIESSRAIFTQNVFISQGSIQIKAQKVIINRPQNKKQKKKQNETLEAFGYPVYFQQTLDDGKVVYGEGDKVLYDISNEFVVLTGQAKLRQAENQIEGREITYDVKEQQLKANGSSKKRVRTVILPSQFEHSKTTSDHIKFNANAPLRETTDLKLQKKPQKHQHKPKVKNNKE